MQLSHMQTTIDEARYDPETLRKVISLAGRLQQEGNETLTAAEVEAVGAEVGLDSAYIRKALSQIETRTSQATKLTQRSKSTTHTKVEFNSALFALTFPIIYGAFAYLSHRQPDLATICTEVIPAPLAALLGFVSGRRKIGMLAGATLAISLAATYGHMYWGFWREPNILVLTLAGAWLGWFGGGLREKHFLLQSPDADKVVSRPAILEMLTDLESRLEAKKREPQTDGVVTS